MVKQALRSSMMSHSQSTWNGSIYRSACPTQHPILRAQTRTMPLPRQGLWQRLSKSKSTQTMSSRTAQPIRDLLPQSSRGSPLSACATAGMKLWGKGARNTSYYRSAHARPAFWEICQGSSPKRLMASSHLSSRLAVAKTASISPSVTSQALSMISASSWPASQPE